MAEWAFHVGQALVVVDASEDRRARRPPFKTGAGVTVQHATAHHYLQLTEYPGLWAACRFRPET